MNSNNSSFSHKKCTPCSGYEIPMAEVEVIENLKQLDPRWQSEDNKSITCELIFKDFKQALSFINGVGDLAEAEGHHPDITLHSYKKVKIILSTHAIDGLSENDFILASKTDLLLKSFDL